jgi:hypothetical protein|nr:MAG TPA: DNA gyrase subunit A [Caudoviricetes sp.]
MKAYCCECGKEFHPRMADVKRGWGKFCSKRCKAIKQNDERIARDYQDQVYIPMEEDIFYIPVWDRIEE